MMNRIEHLQNQYDDARSRWWTAGPEELRSLRDQMFRSSRMAEGWFGDDGRLLADSMRTLAEGLDGRIFSRKRTA